MDEGLADKVAPMDAADGAHLQSKEVEYLVKPETCNRLEFQDMVIPGEINALGSSFEVLGDFNSGSISELVFSLKSSFLPKDFAKVAEVLTTIYDKMKLEIATLKQQKDSFSDEFEEERLDKMNLQEKLKKCEKDCEENMIDLRSRNCELECALSQAESELEKLRKRFQELDKKVLNLEADFPLLENQEDLKSNEIGGEKGRTKPVEAVKVEEVSFGQHCDSPVRYSGHSPNTGSGRPPSQNIIEIVDSDSDDDSRAVVILSGKRMTHPAENSISDLIGRENGTATLKRKQTSSIDVGQSEDVYNDANLLNGKLKVMKLQEPVCRPDVSSDCNEVNKGFAIARGDFMFSRQCEQQPESEQKSENLIIGFPLDGLGNLEGCSCSSDSDSDDDNDGLHILFNHSQVAPDSQTEDRN